MILSTDRAVRGQVSDMRGVSLPTLDVMRFNHGWAEGSEPEVSAGGVRGSRVVFSVRPPGLLSRSRCFARGWRQSRCGTAQWTQVPKG